MNERAHSVVTNIAAIADGCARHRAGLCQEEVAARMFTTKSVVLRLERERARPTLRTIEH